MGVQADRLTEEPVETRRRRSCTDDSNTAASTWVIPNGGADAVDVLDGVTTVHEGRRPGE